MNNTQHDDVIINYIRGRRKARLAQILVLSDIDPVDGETQTTVKELDTILKRLVSEQRLITDNGIEFRLPHGDHKADYRFTIREAKRVDNTPLWGIVWDFGGESWSWGEYGLALDYARESWSWGEYGLALDYARGRGVSTV